MSTLVEIEEAIEQLPASLVDELAQWLEEKRSQKKSKPVTEPDFLARAKAIWGESPNGSPLSSVVAEARH